jgi:hypothetical protein
MTLQIDLTTPEKMDAFEQAMIAAAKDGNAVNLEKVATAAGVLAESSYETEHYEIVDKGEVEYRYEHRYAVLRKAKYAKSRVMQVMPATSKISRDALIPALHEAEAFHMEQLQWMPEF